MTAPNYPHRALRQINVGGVVAFGSGDLIPAEHINTLGLQADVDYEDNPHYTDAQLEPSVGASDDVNLDQLPTA